MKPSKFLNVVLASIMVLAVLAACAAPATTTPSSGAAGSAGQPTAAAAQPKSAATTAPAATTGPAAGAAATQPAGAAGAGKKFVFATDATFPPMETIDDKTKQITGFDPDLLAAVAKDQGFTFEIKNTAWDGIFAGLEAGQYDGIISSVTVTDDRKQKYDFSDPYFDANQGIVVRPDSTIKSGDDLKGKKVGVQIETTGAIAVRKTTGEEPKQYDSPDLAMQDLVNKNIDAVVVDYPVAANFALQSPQFQGKLKIAGQLVTNEKYALCVPKGDPKKLLPLFNAGLKNVKANGSYDKIFTQWIGQPTAK